MVATTEAQFDPPYWASKSPEILQMVARIKQAGDPATKQDIAVETAKLLAAAGRTGPADLVDNAIMVWGWGPFFCMQLRQQLGEATIMDGTNTYPIKVSVDLNDYPPYAAQSRVVTQGVTNG